MFLSTSIMRAGLVSVLLLGCSGDDFTPTVDNVAGAYVATAFTVTEGTETTDLLDDGATFSIELATDGATTGQLFIPGGAEDGGDIDASMEGEWSLSGTTVTFTQGADTFVRDMDFTASENELRGDEVFGDVTVTVVLRK